MADRYAFIAAGQSLQAAEAAVVLTGVIGGGNTSDVIYDTADGTTDGTEVLVAGSGAAITNIAVQLDAGLYVVNGGQTPMTVLFNQA